MAYNESPHNDYGRELLWAGIWIFFGYHIALESILLLGQGIWMGTWETGNMGNMNKLPHIRSTTTTNFFSKVLSLLVLSV